MAQDAECVGWTSVMPLQAATNRKVHGKDEIWKQLACAISRILSAFKRLLRADRIAAEDENSCSTDAALTVAVNNLLASRANALWDVEYSSQKTMGFSSLSPFASTPVQASEHNNSVNIKKPRELLPLSSFARP